MRKIAFIIPEVTSFISGGNLYNQSLLNAIREEVSVSQYRIEGIPEKVGMLEEDIFFIDSLYLTSFAPFMSSKKVGQKFYLIVHHLYSMYPSAEDLLIGKRKEEELRQLQKYNGFLVTSQFTLNYLRKKQLYSPIVILPPVPTILARGETSRNQCITVLIVANLLSRKGILPLLEAINSYAKKGTPNFKIQIIGETSLDKSYTEVCFSLVSKSPFLQQVLQFTGPIQPMDLHKAYQKADLLISASGFETFGMALQEAKCYGIPILARKGGNTAKHIQEGINGHLFDSLSELVKRFFQLVEHPTTLYQLKESAIQYKKGLEIDTWEHHAKKLLALTQST